MRKKKRGRRKGNIGINGKLHNGKWKMIQWKMENEDEKI